jgi:hypothetical protein
MRLAPKIAPKFDKPPMFISPLPGLSSRQENGGDESFIAQMFIKTFQPILGMPQDAP